ncbi:hypothetical protein GGD89_000661 [Roseospira visakhapatnamensis]|uniref:Uncharacterized protein n=1 Tax=Roseospira visakhapatnamensis TaxID=390880 RepID=A0A7W6RAX7_9PROT|nr:hypothetical protein [Roseospira visakhapatnamensis]
MVAVGLGVSCAGPTVAASAGAAEAGPVLAAGDLTLTLDALVAGPRRPDDPKAGAPCLATMRIGNRSTAWVRTFAMRLLVHDPQGVVVRRVSVLAMPLPPGKTTMATFPVLDTGCAGVGSLTILDFPQCADGAGRGMRCRTAAIPDSRVTVPLTF